MNNRRSGFTIVELLIVIVVIAILAAISVVAYNSIQTRARNTVLQSDLRNAATQLGADNATDGYYPSGSVVPSNLVTSDTNSFQYTSDGANYCLTATSSVPDAGTYHIGSATGTVQEGACDGHVAGGSGGGTQPIAIADGSYIQDITSANCPTTRTRAVDARDNHTYWVQQLADGKCWMLTNLAYAGGGTNTYSDVKTLTNGTSDSTTTYTVAKYYIPAGANVTTEPTAPSTSTDGTGQYGYYYNWCAAMGGQATAACTSTTTPAPDPSISICPSGWRLPTGGSGGEAVALNTAVNGGAAYSNTGLRTTWLGQRVNFWYNSFSSSYYGQYWTSTPSNGSTSMMYATDSPSAGSVNTAQANSKNGGFALRCLAS